MRPAQLAGLEVSDYSTIVETDREVVVERTMIWSTTGRFGSHSERAVNAPSTTWFFAEGATHGAFDTFYLLENPSATRAEVEIVYLLPNGAAPIVADRRGGPVLAQDDPRGRRSPASPRRTCPRASR